MFLLCRFENKKASTRKGRGSNSYTVNATRLRPLVPRRFQKQQIGRSSGFRVILLAAPSQVSPVAYCSFHHLLQLRVSEGISPSSLFSAPKCSTSCFTILTTCSKKIQDCQIKHHEHKKVLCFYLLMATKITNQPYIKEDSDIPLQAEMADHPKTEGQVLLSGPFFQICFATPELFAILP
jgi:hypothetical protein